jgi:hypothetical protein
MFKQSKSYSYEINNMDCSKGSQKPALLAMEKSTKRYKLPHIGKSATIQTPAA